jgi:trehalose 6-phosphate phosphatase
MKNWRDAIATTLQTLIEKPRLGLIADMDGTLSYVVNTPGEAQVTPRNKQLLRDLLAILSLVAVVTGRAADDVQARVGVDGVIYVGNHGMERWVNGRVEVSPLVKDYQPAVESVTNTLRVEERNHPGLFLEPKGVTLSIHYRGVENHEKTADILRPLIHKISEEQGLTVFEGRMIFEVRPPVELNKGSAFRELVSEYALDGAIFMGDDVTDVDAMIAARQLREDGSCYAFGFGVGSDETPLVVLDRADFLVDGVADVEEFLSWALKARMASSS